MKTKTKETKKKKIKEMTHEELLEFYKSNYRKWKSKKTLEEVALWKREQYLKSKAKKGGQ